MDSCRSGVTCEVIHGKALYKKNLSRAHHNEDIKVARWENDSWDCRASAAQLGFVGSRARYREGQRSLVGGHLWGHTESDTTEAT